MLDPLFKTDLLFLMNCKVLDSLGCCCFDFLFKTFKHTRVYVDEETYFVSLATLDVMLFEVLQMRDIVLIPFCLFCQLLLVSSL